ncbi:MAG: cupin domain-containing protein [Candidatus Bathyarchaeia archaeon]
MSAVDTTKSEFWEIPHHKGVKAKLLMSGDAMTMIQVEFGPGSSGPEHVHSHEQIGFVLKGELELRAGGNTYALKEGYSYWIPPNMQHAMRGIGDGGIAVEVFHPVREDLLERRFAPRIQKPTT